MEYRTALTEQSNFTYFTYKRKKPYKKKFTSNIKNKKTYKLLDKIILYKQKKTLSELVLCFESKQHI